MSVKRYLALPDAEDTLQNARLLLWHDFGLNELYRGDGKTPDGDFEYIVPCTRNDGKGGGAAAVALTTKDLRDVRFLRLRPFRAEAKQQQDVSEARRAQAAAEAEATALRQQLEELRAQSSSLRSKQLPAPMRPQPWFMRRTAAAWAGRILGLRAD